MSLYFLGLLVFVILPVGIGHGPVERTIVLFILGLCSTIAVAVVSYFLIERPYFMKSNVDHSFPRIQNRPDQLGGSKKPASDKAWLTRSGAVL